MEPLKPIVLGIIVIAAGLFWVRRMNLDEAAAERRRLGLGPMENQEGARLAMTVFFVLAGTALVLGGIWQIFT